MSSSMYTFQIVRDNVYLSYPLLIVECSITHKQLWLHKYCSNKTFIIIRSDDFIFVNILKIKCRTRSQKQSGKLRRIESEEKTSKF